MTVTTARSISISGDTVLILAFNVIDNHILHISSLLYWLCYCNHCNKAETAQDFHSPVHVMLCIAQHLQSSIHIIFLKE